jgi:hypothetical protein
MTLIEVIRAIESIASSQPSIKMVVENDVFRLNSRPDAKYGVFAWTQGQHTTSIDSSVINYSFSFIYVDRLRADMGNQIEIQSVGIETLDNIIRTLDEIGIYTDTSYSFQVFNQRFLDECAGVFCNVTLSVPVNSICPEEFANVDNLNIY